MKRATTMSERWQTWRGHVRIPADVALWITEHSSHIGCTENCFVGAMLLLQYQAYKRGIEGLATLDDSQRREAYARVGKMTDDLEESGFVL